ncbi:MAG TPA: cupin domain-containing protein [Blastocatellia bacterium]|nr:cupin domain-containing protein [Blastocatellia bacterium]
MFHIVNRRDQKKGAIAAVEFEGHPFGAGISFLQGNLEPGRGPGLHKHPYPETCIVLSGRAAMVVDGQDVIAGAGDVVVIGSDTPHRFTAVGDEPLVAVAIHASDRFIIATLSD